MTTGTAALEDKKAVALHAAKARDLQAKISVFVNIEKVTFLVAFAAWPCLNDPARMSGHVSSSYRRRRRRCSSLKDHRRSLQNSKTVLGIRPSSEASCRRKLR
jgi:hypothetical protein